jgi:hypothetical protein
LVSKTAASADPLVSAKAPTEAAALATADRTVAPALSQPSFATISVDPW